MLRDRPNANTFTVGLFAELAQYERETISRRTKDALTAKKVRGATLGTPVNLTDDAGPVGGRPCRPTLGNPGLTGKLRAWPGHCGPRGIRCSRLRPS